MNGLGVLTGSRQPGGDGAFIQAKGGDDGGQRAAMGQEGQHEGDQGQIGVQAVGGRVAGGGERLPAAFALIARVLTAMNADLAVPDHAPCRAGWVMANLGLRVQSGRPPHTM